MWLVFQPPSLPLDWHRRTSMHSESQVAEFQVLTILAKWHLESQQPHNFAKILLELLVGFYQKGCVYMVVVCTSFGLSEKRIINKGFNPLDITCEIVDENSGYFFQLLPPTISTSFYWPHRRSPKSRVLCVPSAYYLQIMGDGTWQFKDLELYGDAGWWE